MRHTPPNTNEHFKVEQALEAIKGTAIYVNDRKRDAENITKLAEVRDIAGIPLVTILSSFHSPQDLFSNSGYFVAEASFRYRELYGKSSRSVNRHIILMERVLIISKTKNQAKAKRKYASHIYLKDALHDYNEEGFKIMNPNFAFILTPEKPGQRLEWQGHFERLLGKKQAS